MQGSRSWNFNFGDKVVLHLDEKIPWSHAGLPLATLQSPFTDFPRAPEAIDLPIRADDQLITVSRQATFVRFSHGN